MDYFVVPADLMYLVSLKGGHSRPLFLYYRLSIQLTANIFSLLKLLMAGFEPESSGFGSDCSANCAPLRKVGRRFFLKRAIPGLSFFIFVFSIQLTVIVQYKFCRWPDSKRRPLEYEATDLPTQPQPLPPNASKLFLKRNVNDIVQLHPVRSHRTLVMSRKGLTPN